MEEWSNDYNNIPSGSSNDAKVDTSSLNEEKVKLFYRMNNTNETMYITGKAGSGKSFLLNFFVENTRKKVAVVAPTGIAALNVNGQTIHSFFGFPPADVQDLEKIKKEGVFGKRRQLLRELDTIVIDEASMVCVDLLNAIDLKLRLANGVSAPFGGKQVILFGDLYQLPPVVRPQVNRYLTDKYGSIFFFAAAAFRRIPLNFYELKTVFRQSDVSFVAILNDIRVGKMTQNELEALNSRYGVLDSRAIHNRFITLTPRNDTVARINQERLDQISRPEYTYTAVKTGDFKKNAYPTEFELKLKVGAQVMMLVNDNTDDAEIGHNVGRRWVNGTLGVISELTEDSVKVMINKVEHTLDKHTWEKLEYRYDAETKKLVAKTVGTFTQYPIKLAWAMTIHKAQGQTYKSVAIDLGDGVFAAGQTYVALSRCISLSNLYLVTPIRREDVIVNQEVLRFMRQHEDYVGEQARVYDARIDGDLGVDIGYSEDDSNQNNKGVNEYEL